MPRQVRLRQLQQVQLFWVSEMRLAVPLTLLDLARQKILDEVKVIKAQKAKVKKEEAC